MNTYPDKNPFPYQGTMTVEATSDPESDDSYQIPRTLALEPVRQTLTLVRAYLKRFSGAAEEGQFAALRGDHGSGKTHAIRYVMDRTMQSPFAHDAKLARPTQLYAQAKTPDFLVVYKQLVSQIPIEELQEINLRFLGVVASEQVGKSSSDHELQEQMAAKLRDNPARVYELFNNYLVEQGAVQERQKAEVRKLSPGGGDDFRRAFSYVLSPELARAAYNWLIGQPISEGDQGRLGVSGPIASAEIAVLSLQLLAALFNRVRHPLIIFIDQYEKLVLSDDKTLAAGNAGLLHSLVEIVPRENGMCVIAGNEEAWEALPRDLKSRFAGNVVDFPLLRPEEASEMIRLYLTSTAEEFELKSGTPLSEISDEFFPFDDEAVKKIVSYSAGNIRRLLQISSKVFEAALPDKRAITTGLVDRVLREGNLAYYSYENVLDEIEIVLRDHSLRFKRAFRIGKVEADLAALDTADSVQLLIEINEAAFHEQEAKRALETLNRVQEIRQQGVQAPIVFVALGYVSTEVTKTIRELTQYVIIYKPELFRTELGKVLDRLERTAPSAPSSRKEIETLEAKLLELSTKLEQVLSAREAESDVVESRLAKFFEKQTADRLEEKRQGARPAWAEERRRIEKEIQAAREKRAQTDLKEMERLRDRGESDRRRRSWLQASCVLLPSLAFFLFGMAREDYPGPIISAVFHALLNHPWGYLLELAILFAVITLLRARSLIGPALYRELAAPVSSGEELERLANQYVMLRKERTSGPTLRMIMELYRAAIISLFNPFPSSIRRLLRDPNPHYRYVGVVAADAQGYKGRFMRTIKAERSSIVRRAIAQRLGRVIEFDEALEELLPRFLPEMAYIVDAAGGHAPISGVQDWPRPLNILVAIYGEDPGWNSDSLAITLTPGGRRRYGGDGLMAAFHEGIDRVPPSELAQLPEFRVRDALSELSPFDEGGLGTFDELKCISNIDQFYLFFRQLLFFMERDLLAAPPA